MIFSIGFIRILFYTIIALMIAFLAFQSLRSLRVILGVAKRSPKDVGQLAIPPSPMALNLIVFLQSIGFHRLGEAQVTLPGGKPFVYHLLVHADRSILAEVTSSIVSFSTHFDENVLVVTDCPKGENINTPDYQSHTITTNLGDAFYYHQQQSEKFKTRFGAPAALSNMADYLQWEQIGRENYGIAKLKRFLIMDWVNFGLSIYGVVILAGMVLIRYFQPIPIFINISLEAIELMGIGLLLPVLLVPNILSVVISNGSKRDSRLI